MESVSLGELVKMITTDQETYQTYAGELINFMKEGQE